RILRGRAASSAGSRPWHDSHRRWLRHPSPVLALQRPAFFMDLSVVLAADEPEVLELRWPAVRPEFQVVGVAPGRRPVAPGKDAVPIARHHRAPHRRRGRPAGMRDLVFEFANPGDAGDRGIAPQPAYGFGRNRSTPLELAGRGAGDASEGVDARRHDQLRTRARAIAGIRTVGMATARSTSELGKCVMRALPGAALVAFARLHEGLHRRAQSGCRLGHQLALDPRQAVDRLADLEPAALIGPIALRQRRVGADLRSEAHTPELP